MPQFHHLLNCTYYIIKYTYLYILYGVSITRLNIYNYTYVGIYMISEYDYIINVYNT